MNIICIIFSHLGENAIVTVQSSLSCNYNAIRMLKKGNCPGDLVHFLIVIAISFIRNTHSNCDFIDRIVNLKCIRWIALFRQIEIYPAFVQPAPDFYASILSVTDKLLSLLSLQLFFKTT